MAKRKKPHKKIHRTAATKNPRPTAAAGTNSTGSLPLQTLAAPTPAAAKGRVAAAPVQPQNPVTSKLPTFRRAVPVAIDRQAYVAADVRRVGVLITLCILIEIGLWLLFNYTGLGAAVYSHITL